MRQFINKDGKYIITLPIDWFHKNKMYDAKETDADSFELLDDPIGTFQITLTTTDKGMIPDIIKKNNIKSQEYGKRNLDVTENFFPSTKLDMYLWFVVIENNFFMAKYIYDSTKRDDEIVKNEIEKAKKALKTLIFVEDKFQKAVFTRFQFDKFMYSLASAIELTNKAYKNINPIELVILLANRIDAGLRLCLILQHQIETNSDFIDLKLIYQAENDKAIMEKKIYKMALEKGIIDEELNTRLYNLYNERNKVVHRYIISDITTKEVIRISIEYGLLEKKIGEIIKELEQKQFKNKIGIYGSDDPNIPLDGELKLMVQNAINEKHSDYSFINLEEQIEE